MSNTHSDRLERWCGAEAVQRISTAMRGWYGPPIILSGVPGNVYAASDGDFVGVIEGGQFLSGLDWSLMRLGRIFRNASRRQLSRANAGFSSLSDIISEATSGGKQRLFQWEKEILTMSAPAGGTASHWQTNSYPTIAPTPSAAPGGDATTDASVGAPAMDNVSPDTRHVVSSWGTCSLLGKTFLLYDRLFQVSKTMNSAAAESVTGVPTRYQSTTPGDADYIGGNFGFVETGTTALAATAHTWTACTYKDQDGNASTLPDLVGNASSTARRLDHPVGQWYAPLASGDRGIKAWTNIQCSAQVATGLIHFVIGHPLCWMPIHTATLLAFHDHLNRPFGRPRVFDDAALAILDVLFSGTGNYNMNITVNTVAG